MKIELNVDGAQLSDDVKHLLDNLTPEQKRDMAFQLLKETMSNTEMRFSKELGVEHALKELNKSGTKYRLVESSNGDTNLQEYTYGCWSNAPGHALGRFNKLANDFSKPHTYFRETILKEILETAVNTVEATVKKSSKIQTAISVAVKEIENNIPEMIQNAMRHMFVDVLTQAMNTQNLAFEAKGNQQNLLGEIIDRLNRNNIC